MAVLRSTLFSVECWQQKCPFALSELPMHKSIGRAAAVGVVVNTHCSFAARPQGQAVPPTRGEPDGRTYRVSLPIPAQGEIDAYSDLNSRAANHRKEA